ncbi:hypothetical protein [Lysobacter gummosus]|uniref:hypothetical protein n=1 Tax=Lysobacter gummosus TaxID=262324 RepID=UPI0036258BDA
MSGQAGNAATVLRTSNKNKPRHGCCCSFLTPHRSLLALSRKPGTERTAWSRSRAPRR